MIDAETMKRLKAKYSGQAVPQWEIDKVTGANPPAQIQEEKPRGRPKKVVDDGLSDGN